MPGYLEDFGTAHSNATVTLNPDFSVGAGPQPLYRHGDYFRAELVVDNTVAPLWQGMTNIGVLNNGTNADIVTTNLNQVFLPATPETFQHDPDGNLTNDGRFSYTWDAENRLTTATSPTNAPVGSKRKLTFEYDQLGRRVRLGVSVWTNNNWLVTTSNKFCYDGWNLVAELNATNNAVIRTYAWGLDLSGTMQDAGGVGGLLWVNDSSTLNSQPSTHLVSYDGNGNVTALVDAGNGIETARYEYGPFGDVLRAEGAMAKANPFRFSTKYQDDERDLIYYGYRYYSLTFQRWLNRDPLGEEGGLNLYGFVDNNPINATDALGLVSSLNFVPASELAWMFGGGAALSGGLSIGMQKLASDPCDENWLDWNKVGKDVRNDALITAGTLGFSKLWQIAKAARLANELRKAENLRELGRYDELTEMLSKYGDEFGDAYTVYKRERAAAQVVSESRALAHGVRTADVGAATQLETSLSKYSGRNAIMSKLDDVVDPTVVRQLDPSALVGYRGSLARGFKGAHKGGGPFDPQSFDVDAFIVSDKLARQIGRRGFRDAGHIPILREAQSNIDTTLRLYPEFRGLKSNPFTFRVFTTKEWRTYGKAPFKLFSN